MLLPETMTDRETDYLWWRLISALGQIGDEIEHLERCPKQLRDSMYGTDCLEQLQATRDEIADLVTVDILTAPAGPDPLAGRNPGPVTTPSR